MFQPFPDAQRYRKLKCIQWHIIMKRCFYFFRDWAWFTLFSAMPFPFGKSQKSPAEIVRSLKEHVAYMEKLDAGDSKKCEKVSAGVSSARLLF